MLVEAHDDLIGEFGDLGIGQECFKGQARNPPRMHL